MQRFCLTLDLRPDPALIEAYIEHHKAVWPEILESLRNAGILDMQIYNTGTRLLMIMDTNDDFTLEAKAKMDNANEKVREWETLMGRFQQVDQSADPTTRWQLMTKVFQL